MVEVVGSITAVVALILVTALWGRAFCGRLCPLGYLQGLLFKIPFPLKLHRFRVDRYLRWLKYAVLALCLATNLLAVLPREAPGGDVPAIGTIAALLVAALLLIIIQRPFCKYVCPGALLGLGNRSPLNRYRVDDDICTSCGVCSRACKMDIDPTKAANSIECIRCESCKKHCPQKAIASG